MVVEKVESLLVKVVAIGITAVTIAAYCSQTEAGINRWSSIGPEGSTVHTLAVSPVDQNVIYISVESGIYRSTDGGGYWLQTGPGVGGWINSLTADRVNPDIVYAASATGAYKSSDCGTTWVSIKAGLPYNYVALIVVDQGNSLYAINVKADYSAAELYKSVNGGGSWELISPDPAPPQSSGDDGNLLIDPSNAAVLYRSNRSRIFRSTDGGRQWAEISHSQTGKPGELMAVDPLTSDVIYGVGGDGLFRSDDAGATWTDIQAGILDSYIVALAIDPVHPSTLYVGTYILGLFKSTDRGNSWVPLKSAFPGPISVQALAVSLSDPTVLFCGIRDLGFYESRDAGASWNPKNSGLPSTREINVLTGLQTGAFFAGTDYGPYLRNADGSWLLLPAGLECTQAYSCSDFREIAVDSMNPQLVYAATGDGIYKSVNGGQRWGKAGALPNWVTWITALAMDPVHPQVLYAGTSGTSSSGSLYKSVDGAVTWDYCSNGIPDYRGIESLLVDPTEPSIVYCGTSDQLYKSTNGGASWTALFYTPNQPSLDSPNSVSGIALDPLDSSTVFAVGRDVNRKGRVYRSTDAGATWKSVYACSLRDSRGMAIVIDPVSPATIYATVYPVGILKSEDRGQTWYPMNTGFQSPAATDLLIDPRNAAVLYAGTSKGVYEYRSDPAGPAELTLISPNGDETWTVGSTVTIRWMTVGSSPAISHVAIDYSLDDGASYSELVASAPNSGAYTLVFPAISGALSRESRIRIRALEGTSWDVSDRPFRIYGCYYYTSQTGRVFGPGGGLGDVSVSTYSVCSWSADGENDWIQVLSGTSKLGRGVVQYNVSPNNGGTDRVANLSIAGGAYKITQSACQQAIALTAPPLPTAALHVTYTWTIKAACGTGAYSFALASGSLPPGLRLLPSGVIEGVPTTSGAFSFSVRVTDSADASQSQSYTLRVARNPRPSPRVRRTRTGIE